MCWAFCAELDIVVTAHGKLVPVNIVQVTQPAESGLIRRVLVKDGENVAARLPKRLRSENGELRPFKLSLPEAPLCVTTQIMESEDGRQVPLVKGQS